jgi:urea carboxylase
MIQLPAARYTFGGDEHIFVEIADEMSLPAFFKGMAITTALRQRAVPGITEICPANASFLVRFDPDVIAAYTLLAVLQEIESQLGTADMVLDTRVVEIPVLYGDPWTLETQMRFRDRHQDPTATDLEYAARINQHPSVEAFIAAHAGAPWFVSMVGFVAGLPFLFQMVERAQQIEVPKYLRPRTDTPRLTLGHGGCFSCIYSVRGAGGYQMFGITPAPIFDPEQKLPYLRDMMVFFRPGDIVKWKPITREQYDQECARVEAGSFDLRIRPLRFSLSEFLKDPAASNAAVLQALDA